MHVCEDWSEELEAEIVTLKNEIDNCNTKNRNLHNAVEQLKQKEIENEHLSKECRALKQEVETY